MKLENKKYLVYGGLAVIVGSIGYIAYSLIFKKKPIVVKDSEVVTEEVKSQPTSTTNPFKDMLDNPVIKPSIDWKWGNGNLLPLTSGGFDWGKAKPQIS